jgi:hypothetical protein
LSELIAPLFACVLTALTGTPWTFERIEEHLRSTNADADAVLEMRVAFLDAVFAEKRREVLAAEQVRLQGWISRNEARFAEGAVAERDLIRVRIEASRVEIDVSRASAERDVARMRLAKLLGFSDVEVVSPADEAWEAVVVPLTERALAAAQALALVYEAARERIRTFKLRLLSASEESVEIEDLLYSQMKTDLIALLDAARARRNILLDYYQTLYEASAARFRMERLVTPKFHPR